MKRHSAIQFLVSFFTLLLVTTSASAAPAAERAPTAKEQRNSNDTYDTRYHHNRTYPSRGQVVSTVPTQHTVIVEPRSQRRYYYADAVWYESRGPRFVIVGPPIGVFVPILPHFYTTIWIGGFPYYYANGTYYAWRDASRRYEVVEPPAESESTATTEPPASDELFVYPKNGQTPDQTARDRYECHRWASGETGFDPTQAGGGVAADQTATKRADYFRAITACLEARGYSVK